MGPQAHLANGLFVLGGNRGDLQMRWMLWHRRQTPKLGQRVCVCVSLNVGPLPSNKLKTALVLTQVIPLPSFSPHLKPITVRAAYWSSLLLWLQTGFTLYWDLSLCLSDTVSFCFCPLSSDLFCLSTTRAQIGKNDQFNQFNVIDIFICSFLKSFWDYVVCISVICSI